MTTKKQREAMVARTEELKRMASVDEENVSLRLRVAEQQAELAQANRLATSERQARLDLEERLGWICKLAGSGARPRDLGDSRPR